MQISKDKVFEQMSKYPATRYMGSKQKLIPPLYDIFNKLKFDRALDIMSGTGVISYLLKCMGKQVISNDYMHMNYTISSALIKNNSIKINNNFATKLLETNLKSQFITKTFKDLYFTESDSIMIDSIRNNITSKTSYTQKAICMSALIRSCIKKRPRGIFAYTGLRYDDGRKDLKKSIEEHFIENINIMNNAIFSNKKNNKALNEDCMDISDDAQLVYIDPPYFSKLSDNEYVRRYHFVEGLSKNWENIQLQESTKTKKFKSYPSPFTRLDSTIEAFNKLFNKYKKNHIILSYSSNSLPSKEVILSLLSKYKKHVYVNEINYRYSFSNQDFAKDKIKNKVKEYIFVGTE